MDSGRWWGSRYRTHLIFAQFADLERVLNSNLNNNMLC